MELTPLQVLVIGALASVLAQAIKLIAAKAKGQVFSKEVVTLIALAASLIMAVIPMWPQLKELLVPGGDPMQVAQSIVVAASAVMGSAGVIYNLLLEKLSEKMNLTQLNMIATVVEE